MQQKLFFIVLILKYFWLFFKQNPVYLHAAVAVFQILYTLNTVLHRAEWMVDVASVTLQK